MSGGFSFPPPPPPPPKAVQTSESQPRAHIQSYDRGRGRGRGNDRGGHNQRGRANPSGRGNRGATDYPQQFSLGPNGGPQQSPQQNFLDVQSYQPFKSGQFTPLQHHTQSLPPGTYINPNFASTQTQNSGSAGPYSQPQLPRRSNNDLNSKASSPPRTAAGHKRKLEALRGAPQEQKKLTPQTAPSAPSFGAAILAPMPTLTAEASKKTRTDGNKSKAGSKGLGLTPATYDPVYSSSDNEDEDRNIDEEALHAELGDQLTFEHNGVVMSLQSQSDLEAWRKERQKNWPTKARMVEKNEERGRIGEERKRLLAGASLLARPYKSKKPQKRDLKTRRGGSFGGQGRDVSRGLSAEQQESAAFAKPETELERAKREVTEHAKRLEELRRKVARSAARNQKVQAEAQRDHENVRITATELRVDNSEENQLISIADTHHDSKQQTEADDAEEAADVSKDSSSDSSSLISSVSSSEADSDDEPPEEVASKPPVVAEPVGPKPVCKHFAASGYCRDGDACRFRHEGQTQGLMVAEESQHVWRKPEQNTRRSHPGLPESATQRKSISQRLVEQEQDEEDRLALQVIKYLGKAGFFRECSVEDL